MYRLNKLSIVIFFAAIMLTVIALTQSKLKAAPDPVWIDYDIHERDVIEVKLNDGLQVRAVNGRLTPTNNAPLDPALQALPASDWQPVFETDEATLNAWRENAIAETGKPSPELALYFHVQLPDGVEAGEALAEFRASPSVEGAYPVDKPIAPPIPPDYVSSNDGNFDPAANTNIYQRYLDAAPEGMDVRYAWEGIGGRGDGIDICDVEYGFEPHSDLPAIIYLAIPVSTYQLSYTNHGTAVLGMLGSRDNGWGTTGMVTDARLLFSPVHPITGNFNIANAISRCISTLNAGDVILIEQQGSGQSGNYVPVEWDPAVYAVIQTAVSNGIVVVEAAGNGNEDLDDNFYLTAKPSHTPFAAGSDSGAIIIGSANSIWTPDPLTRRDGSTYGDTVDLHGWGMHLLAPGYGNYYSDDGDLLSYTLFGGTSGASPMVTAAAAIIQSNYIAKDGVPASPAQVKQLLRDNGTPQVNVNGENIGPMPDLYKAINALWGIPDPAKPIISPVAGAYPPPLNVTIAYGSGSQNSSNTHIRYTLDGSEPTVDSYIYIPEQGDSIHLLYTAEVRTKAFSSNVAADRFFASDTAAATFGLVAPKVAAPQISPDGGYYNQSQQVTISTSTPDAIIKYRTDGRAPSFFYPGTTYSDPISLSPGTYNITARAYKDGFYKSDATYAAELTLTPITLPTPTIYPDGDTFVGIGYVYLGSTVLGAEIRYTTDGTEPTGTSSLYGDPIVLTSNTTVKARIFLDGYTPSGTKSASFTVIESIPAPSFHPASGTTADDSLTVYLSTTVLGAEMRYTTNGSEPTVTSPLYTDFIPLTPGQYTLKARAYYNGLAGSAVVTATYTVYNTVELLPPTISPHGGIFNGPITVTLESDTEGTFLFYTLDGTDPATSPTVIPYSVPFQLMGDATYDMRARAYLSGVGNSDMAFAGITVVTPTLGIVQMPTISPHSGQYTNTVAATITAPDWSSPFNIRKLYVTTDGAEPMADFTSPGVGVNGIYDVNISTPQMVKVLSAQQGWLDSPIAAAEYTFVCDTPTISDGGTFTGSTMVSISTGTTSGATIYYSTDGNEPTTDDNVYGGAFSVSSSQVVKAMCVRNSFDQSETAVSVFIINAVPVAPSIVTQPQSQAGATCTPTTFTVAATGSAPFSYEWYKDGSIVGGATESALTLAAVLPADAGEYSVRVSNGVGEVLSETAVFTVSGTDSSCVPAYAVYLPTIIK